MADTVTAALFDVDGTLVDSNYLHVTCWREAFAQAGHDVAMTPIHAAVGKGSDQMLDALLPGGRDRQADGSIEAAHSALFATFWARLRPLPHAADLLRACRASDMRVVLASSAGPAELAALRRALAAEDAIDAVTGADEVHASKPAPDLVEVALRKAGVTAGQAVFVGDSVWDVQACQQAGVPCIGLCSGGTSRQGLLAAGASAVFDDPASLLEQSEGRLGTLLNA